MEFSNDKVDGEKDSRCDWENIFCNFQPKLISHPYHFWFHLFFLVAIPCLKYRMTVYADILDAGLFWLRSLIFVVNSFNRHTNQTMYIIDYGNHCATLESLMDEMFVSLF